MPTVCIMKNGTHSTCGHGRMAETLGAGPRPGLALVHCGGAGQRPAPRAVCVKMGTMGQKAQLAQTNCAVGSGLVASVCTTCSCSALSLAGQWGGAWARGPPLKSNMQNQCQTVGLIALMLPVNFQTQMPNSSQVIPLFHSQHKSAALFP